MEGSERDRAEGSATGWIAGCALLAAAAQVAVAALSGRSGGQGGFVSLQTMLTLSPWLALLGFGSDKLARAMRAGRQALWMSGLAARAALAAAGLGALTGAAMAWAMREPAGLWIAFCAAMAAAGPLGAGREMLAASGRPGAAAKAQAAGFAICLCGLAASSRFGWGVAGMALSWALPWAASSLASCKMARMGIPKLCVPAPEGGWAPMARRAAKLAAPGAGLALLCSADVALLRAFGAGAGMALYILLTRSVFIAFAATTVAASRWVPGLMAQGGRGFAAGCAKTFAIHCAGSLSAVAALGACGAWAFGLAIPSVDFHGQVGPALWPLAGLAVARSLAETAFSASVGGRSERLAPWMGAASCAGLAGFAWAAPAAAASAVGWAAMAWAAPGALFLAASALGGKAGWGHGGAREAA